MGVPTKRTLSPKGLRIKRVGQKAISCGRVHTALEARIPKSAAAKKTRRKLKLKLPALRMPTFTPLRLAALGAACVVLVVSGVGFYFWEQEQAKQRSVAEQARIERDREIEKRANECRKQKAEEKADQIGLLTYDQLYDYDECYNLDS